MSDRKTVSMRFGGACVPVIDSVPLDSFLLRRFYCETIRRRAPEVFMALGGVPYRAYHRIYRLTDLEIQWMDLQRESIPQRFRKLRHCLVTWAKEHNLKAPWCYQMALDTIRFWLQFPKGYETRTPLPILVLSEAVLDRTPQLTSASSVSILTHNLREVEDALSAVVKKGVPAAYKKALSRAVAGCRSAYDMRAPEAMGWLVDFQIRGLSIPQIAEGAGGPKRPGKDKATVENSNNLRLHSQKRVDVAIRRLAQRLRLPLRRSERGRPSDLLAETYVSISL